MNRWKPKSGGKYWAVNVFGSLVVRRNRWGHGYDNDYWAAGNCYRTKKEAQAALKRVKAALQQ